MEEEQDGNHINIKQEGTTGGQNVEEETNPKKCKINWESLDSSLNISNYYKDISESKGHSVVPNSATPWTVTCQPPSVHGILQERILEWVATSRTPLSHHLSVLKFCRVWRLFSSSLASFFQSQTNYLGLISSK